MSSHLFQWRSLKTRVTFFTLVIFVISIWSLTFYISRLLQDDMRRVLGEQQFATVSYIAEEINSRLTDHLSSLELIAKEVNADLMSHPVALQARLEQRPLLQILFNGGTFITDTDGKVIASIPVSVGRIGVSYLDRDFMVAALRDGKSTIGRPVMGKLLNSPILVMAVPIRDTHGKLIGALAAVTDLGKPNFLDQIAQRQYGQSGSYLLIAPQHKLFVTATDKSRIMQPLPAPGINAMHDRYMQGYEGFGVAVSSRGVPELSAAKGIPVAGWFVAAVLPAEEAFAPVDAMLRRMLLGALITTLLAGALAWWLITRMLRRQLAPMLAASRLLKSQAASDQPVQALPIARDDEIGELIGGFNRLLESSAKREKALADSEERLKTWFELPLIGIAVTSPEKGWIEVNSHLCDMLGYNREELIKATWAELTHPEDLTADVVQFERTMRGEIDGYSLEKRFLRRTGEILHAELAVGCVRLDDGKVDYFVALIQDITKRRQAENELAKSEERLRRANENIRLAERAAKAGAYIWNFKTGETQWSDEFFRLFGLDPINSDASYETWQAALHPDDLKLAKMQVAEAIRGRRPLFHEYRVVLAGGSTRWIAGHGDLMYDDMGEPQSILGFCIDVTDRKKNEAELEEHRHHLQELVDERTAELALAKEAADAASRAKSTFLANMSHELRTPMTAIMGMVDLVLRKNNDPKQRDQLTKAKVASKHLLLVINDILDLSKIEAGRVMLERLQFRLGGVLDNVVNVIDSKVSEKGLSLRVFLPPEISGKAFIGDPLRLGQILLNYAGNAVKFTHHGEISIRARLIEDDPTTALLQWEVADTGIGISVNDQQRLFTSFEQADVSMTRMYGGTGLGLAISKRFTELMGGQTGVESQPGQGSTFWFTVRLDKDLQSMTSAPSLPHGTAEAQIKAGFAGAKILLAEDEPVNREVSLGMLEDVGLKVDLANDGAIALSLAQENRYALILMDMQMPNLNGVDATRQIRRESLNTDTPILAMTANAFDEDRQVCLDAGMNDHIAKPVEPEVLFETLLKWLSAKTD